MKKTTAPLVWETDLPLFSAYMLRQWSLAMLATALVMGLLLGTLFAAQGNWDALPMLGLMVAGASGGLWVLGLIIMAVLFRGRFHVRYTLSDAGILQETVEPIAKKANRAAIILGVLARKPGLAGAGLIARSREFEAVNWKGAFNAVTQPERHLITLRNGWRTVMFVQCTAENFAEVMERVSQSMQQHKTSKRVATNSPLPFYLRHTALIMLASVPLFMLTEEYGLHLLAPILVLCFALAMLWLINVFAYVIYAGLLYLVVGTLMDLARVRQSSFFPGESYSGFEVMSGDENSILILALIAAGYLIWLSWRALHGGFLALLVKDQSDMDGG
ncbi:MAG: hypothetical protein Q8Q28_03640 [Pseudomonadota bacterium]|nr:hypothetical protein [Pseudomonadota bacterium]